MLARLADARSVFPGLLTLVACTLYGIVFLHAESQAGVLGLIAGALVAVWLLARVDWAGRARTSFAAHPRPLQALTVVAVLAALAVFRGEHFPLLMLATALFYTTACLGLTVQFGYAGVVNFAGAAFFGIGAYTAAVMVAHTPVPHLFVMILGGIVSALIGSALILPVLRTRGHYAALVTIAFGILFRTFIEVNDVLGGPQGLQVKGMNLFGWDLNTPLAIGGEEISFYANYVIVALGLAAVAFVVVRRLERSWIGLNLDAVRLDETVCAVFGIEVGRWKVVAFTLGNFLAGTAGAAYAQMVGFVAPNSFTFGDSLILVSIVILGGMGNAWGVALAAAIVIVLPEKLQALQEYRFLLYACLVIAILLFRPGGLLPRRTREYFPGWRPR
jgi:ABC-type branched-subunit amino acid transport system permease subunit